MLRQSPIATCVRVTLSAVLLFLAAPPASARAQVGGAGASADFVPVTDAMLQDPAPEDWLMWRRTLDSWGYSPLDQGNRENVSQLQLVRPRPMAARTG